MVRKKVEVEVVARPRLLTDLPPYANNSRIHSAEQIEEILLSLLEFGWTIPILADAEGIVAGHGRIEAAALGYSRGHTFRLIDGRPLPKGTALWIDCTGWSEEQRRAYIIADNRIADRAGWDNDVLRGELDFLRGADFSLGAIGFSPGDLTSFFLPKLDGENDPNVEWGGMPSFEQDDKTPNRSIVVHFKDSAGVEAFAKLVGQPITAKTRFLWYPEIQIETYADKRWVDEGSERPAGEGTE